MIKNQYDSSATNQDFSPVTFDSTYTWGEQQNRTERPKGIVSTAANIISTVVATAAAVVKTAGKPGKIPVAD